MEFVVIILLLVIVAILQMVILSNQQKNAKLIRDLATSRSRNNRSDHNRDRSRDRKDYTHRNNRRNQQDTRKRQPAAPQEPPSSGAVDNVEKSLRDINLKLKNAERDQEVARRRINDNTGKEGSGSRRGRNDGNRGGRRDRNNRNNFRGNRNNHDRPSERKRNDTPSEHPAREKDGSHEQSKPNVTIESTNDLSDLNPVDFEPQLEHGRKAQVKRRLLKEDLPGATGADKPDDNASAANSPSTEAVIQPETSNDEISFGRR